MQLQTGSQEQLLPPRGGVELSTRLYASQYRLKEAGRPASAFRWKAQGTGRHPAPSYPCPGPCKLCALLRGSHSEPQLLHLYPGAGGNNVHLS